ncbi:alpha/beta hydrolase [Tessaracoccus sp. MC1627]|nr:alpha/beta hydrolase [Tessaracoccus sp. MC1627]
MPAMHLENRVVLAAAGRVSRVIPGKRVDGVSRRIVRLGDGARLRVYTPATPSGAGLLWIHGGGLVLGAAAMDDRFCGDTAQQLGVVIVSVDYRLAPRHPFPAALDDAHRGWEWLTFHAGQLGISTARLAVGGQSAGGGLAASLVQRLHDEGAGVAAQWLFCPMLDDRTARDRTRDAEDHFVWNNRSNLVGWRSYLGAAFATDDVPRYAVAARREDLSGLPPAWLYASDIELFHDEVVRYAERLRAAGVDTTLDVISGAPHGVEAWAPGSELARGVVGRARQWLGDTLA